MHSRVATAHGLSALLDELDHGGEGDDRTTKGLENPVD